MNNKTAVNIVGKADGKTGIGRHAVAFLNALKESFPTRFIDTRPGESDLGVIDEKVTKVNAFEGWLHGQGISIFTDVTCNGDWDKNWEKTPITDLKVIYTVFDSTAIPPNWIDIINNNFDMVLVPSRFLVDVYKSAGIFRPVFHLPLALDLGDFLRLEAPNYGGERPFRFGFIGSYEPRKNVEKLVDSFVRAFPLGDGSAVELRIHMALDFGGAKYLEEITEKGDQRIIITTGVLEKGDYLGLVEEIDCLVSLSKGEGYSIVPREFLAAGKPVALSDCFAHGEILMGAKTYGDNLVFAVESDLPVRGWFPQLSGGIHCGIQYDCYVPGVADVLRRIYAYRNFLFDESKVALRRRFASSFDQMSLNKLYESVVAPKFLGLDNADSIENGGIVSRDRNVLARYRKITGVEFESLGLHVKPSEPQKYVVIGNDGGFFSVYNRFVSYLAWTVSANPKSVVLPDWRIDAMQRHWHTDKFMSFCYGRPEDGNIWLKLFEPLPFSGVSEADYNDESSLYQGATLKDDYNEKNEPWLTYIHAYKLYKSPDFNRWRMWYHVYHDSFIKLRPKLARTIDNFYESRLKGYTVISAHVRHPSHGIEQPGARMPTVELFCEMIRETMLAEGLDRDKTRIFLATDQDTVVSVFQKEFGELVVYSSEATRTSEAQDEQFQSLDEKEKNREGHQIQHLTAADPARWSVRMAEEVLIDTYLLSKGNYFIHVTSNIATAVSFINPFLKMIYCE